MLPRDYEEPVGFWEWVRALLLMVLPLIGLIMLIYWAASDETKASKRNFARAQLCVMLPFLVLAAGLVAASAIPAFQKVREAAAARVGAVGASSEERAASDDASAPAGESVPSASSTSAPTLTPNEPERGFRSTDGRTIQARVVSLTDERVTIRRADGREFTTEMVRFSAEDVEYFMRLRHGAGAFD